MKILILILFLNQIKNIQDFVNLELEYNSRGELIGEIGKHYIGKKYISGSLDQGDTEKCVINLDGFDCVTFYETSLAIADLVMYQKDINESNLDTAIKNYRYENGILNGYESRLHYSSQWIHDNLSRNRFEDISKVFGGVKESPNVSFMSKNPDKYSRLKGKVELIDKIKKKEEIINKKSIYYIPNEQVKNIENELQTGDIIFFKTNIKGLDYVHTGMIYKKDNNPFLLHASSNSKKVEMKEIISDYLKNKKTIIGITILRPL